MTFKKGQIIKLSFQKNGCDYCGNYEIIRTGSRFYLFCNDNGHDFHSTKTELETIISAQNKSAS